MCGHTGLSVGSSELEIRYRIQLQNHSKIAGGLGLVRWNKTLSESWGRNESDYKLQDGVEERDGTFTFRVE